VASLTVHGHFPFVVHSGSSYKILGSHVSTVLDSGPVTGLKWDISRISSAAIGSGDEAAPKEDG
jgi:hypothetical protein